MLQKEKKKDGDKEIVATYRNFLLSLLFKSYFGCSRGSFHSRWVFFDVTMDTFALWMHGIFKKKNEQKLFAN